LDHELCGKLLQLSATVISQHAVAPPDLSAVREVEMAKRIGEVDQRNLKHFDEEVLKLDHWSDDLKLGLEREIRDLDKEIREVRKTASLATSLGEKLGLQKQIKSLENTRKDKRKRLFDAHDEIDEQRNQLISAAQSQLEQSVTMAELFAIRWCLK
jgi:adenine-specific DNA-methyltransferase